LTLGVTNTVLKPDRRRLFGINPNSRLSQAGEVPDLSSHSQGRVVSMEGSPHSSANFVGIDIAQNQFDVAVLPGADWFTLFFFLKAPQAGIPVIQTGGVAATHWVSSVDMVSLMALILFLFAELIVLIFSLWLLFRATLGVESASS
jgi:hypothetical protein